MRLIYITFISFLLAYCNNPKIEPLESPYLNHSDTVAYVGIETCKQCHYDIYESYIETGMGKSFSLATKENSHLSLEKTTFIVDTFNNFSYYPYWKNDTLFLEEKYKNFSREEVVDYIIGSGHHTNSHLWSENGYVHQMPFTYYTQDSILDFPPGFENDFNSRFSRSIGLECMSCHNALPDFVMGSENKFNRVDQGIDCERCHGPGEVHVHNVTNGIIVDTSKHIDYSIVNPSKLPVEKQFQICMRCHLQGNTILSEGKSFYDFKPGMELSDIMTVFVPKYEDDETFIMASHVDRLKQSSCFQESEDMSCISCHDPHHTVQKASANLFNNKCLSCHSDCSEPDRISNNCIECHMPKSSTIDIPHVSISDHKIGIHYKDSATNLKGKFIGLKSINNDNPSNEIFAKAYLSQFEKFDSSPYLLDSAFHYIQKLDIYTNYHEYLHYYFLSNDFKSILNLVNAVPNILDSLNTQDYQNLDAWAAYRIGEAYDKFYLYDSSLEFHKKSCELAPYVIDFNMKLADVYFNLNELDLAQKQYEYIISEFSKNEIAFCNLAFVLMSRGEIDQAMSYLTKAQEINPRHVQTLLNIASCNMFNNNVKLAKLNLLEVLEIDSDNSKAIYLLDQIK